MTYPELDWKKTKIKEGRKEGNMRGLVLTFVIVAAMGLVMGAPVSRNKPGRLTAENLAENIRGTG